MALALKMNQEDNGHEIVIERPDGQRLIALAHANPIHDETGTLLGAVNVLVDITERKQAEAQLQASHREKEVLLKKSTIASRTTCRSLPACSTSSPTNSRTLRI